MSGGEASGVASPGKGRLAAYWRECSVKGPTAVPANGDYRSAVARLDFWTYLGLIVAGGFAGNRFIAFLKVVFGGWMRTESCLSWWSETCEKSLAVRAGDETEPDTKGADSSSSSGSAGKTSVTFPMPPVVVDSVDRLVGSGKLTTFEENGLRRWLRKLCKEKPDSLPPDKSALEWTREHRFHPATGVLCFLRDKSEACQKEPDASTPDKRREHWKFLHDLQALAIFAYARIDMSVMETDHAVADLEKLDPQSFTEIALPDGHKYLFRPMFPLDRPPPHSYLGQELAAHLAMIALDQLLTVPGAARFPGDPKGFDGYPSNMGNRVSPCVLDGVPGFMASLPPSTKCVDDFSSDADRRTLAANADFRRMATWAQIVAAMVGAVDLQLQDFYFDDGTKPGASAGLVWTNFTNAFSCSKPRKRTLAALNGGIPPAVCDEIWAAIDGLHKVPANLAQHLRDAGLTEEQITRFQEKMSWVHDSFLAHRRLKSESSYGGNFLATEKFGATDGSGGSVSFGRANWLPLALAGVTVIE
ncbi:MAG: hypothetical protein LBF24_00720 [Puniceicoccales bacterium]|jgi:hypothetical protein|nr:hypothetical protein [Puniceicoccales bacterium]